MADLLSTNVFGTLTSSGVTTMQSNASVAGTLTVSGNSSFANLTVSNQLITSGLNILNELAIADNTTRVSANSGSTQSAVAVNFINTASIQVSVGAGSTGNANVAFDYVGSAISNLPVSANVSSTVSANGINFNNTATIRVNVQTGITGNANISFDYIGSVSGGGGINNFPVSANSGSTVTANGLNFVNTSTATISVSAGASGNANVSITPIGVQTQNYASVFSNKQMMEWVHNRDGKIFRIFGGSVTANTPRGLSANTSGTRFYVIDDGSDLIHQLNLSEAWNIASATTETANLSIAGQETSGADLFVGNTGSTLYVLGDAGNDITWYSLSQSWNVQTATVVSQTSISGQTTSPRGFHFKEDGTKFWVVSPTIVYQFSMSTAWDMASASYDSISLTTTVDTALESISIDPTGTKMYLVGSTNDRIYEFTMSTPFNVSTATYNNFSFIVRDIQVTTGFSGTETGPTGVFIAYPNNRMYIVGTAQDTIIQFEMDRGITIEAKKLFANGRAHFMDDVTILGDLYADEGVFAPGGGYFGSGQQCQISAGGTISTSSGSSDIGTSTGTAAYALGSGATTTGLTKAIGIGTNGLAGSFTNINIGTIGGGSANVNINANTVTISNTVNIGNQLIVSGLNILNEIGIADNLTRVAANSGSILSNVALNFINTSSVTVSVTPGEAGYANIAFTSSATGGVTSVATGIGLTGGPIISSGTISANIASTTVQGVTKLIDAVNSNDAANAATGAAVKTAYDQATSAFAKANAALANSTGTFNGYLTVSQNLDVVGNVGIGVTSPTLKLDVLGDSRVNGNVVILNSSSGDALRITQTGTGNAFVVEDSTDPDATPFVVDANGRVAIGGSTLNSIQIFGRRDITGGATSYGLYYGAPVQSDVTSARYIQAATSTAAGFASPLPNVYAFFADEETFNSGANNQYGFATTTLRRAANNYGFYGDLISGLANNTWNFYAAGTANNYFNGSLGLGTTAELDSNKLHVSGNSKFLGNVTVTNQLIVSGVNILNEISLADNTAAVKANSGSTVSNSIINFVNTSTVLVSVGAGTAGSGEANVSLSAVAGSTTVPGILQLTDSTTSTSTTTAATPNSVKLTFDQATLAYGQANTGLNRTQVSANGGSVQSNVAVNFINTASIQVSVGSGSAGNSNISFVGIISAGTVANAATITPVRTGPHSHYAVTSLATAATVNPPAINTGIDGDRLTIRILDNGTGRALSWNTSAGAYRAIGVTLPTTTVASKVLYVGCIYNSQNNFWDAVAFVQQA